MQYISRGSGKEAASGMKSIFDLLTWWSRVSAFIPLLYSPVDFVIWVVSDVSTHAIYPDPTAAAGTQLDNMAEHFKGIGGSSRLQLYSIPKFRS